MLRVLSLFSGIGAFEKALERLGVEHEVLAYCEIDKYASKAYSIIHNIPESKNLRDVTKVDILDVDETVDLITYGFPCQDISSAGKQKGFTDEEGNRTRSGLFFEALRIIDDYRPKFAIAENVKALTSKKFETEFKIVLESLEEIGYTNYYAVLNAKDFGIPQNRERVFIISIRKDIDRGFTFPQAVPLKLRLKDMLEDEIDEKYYLSETFYNNYLLEGTKIQKAKGNGFGYRPRDINGIATAITTMEGSRRDDNFIDTDYLLPGKNYNSRKVVHSPESICRTLISSAHSGNEPKVTDRVRIRKLTPTECYKLMGFEAEDCEKCSEGGISNSQLYKQAGNSIVVNVLEAIFNSLGEIYVEFRSNI